MKILSIGTDLFASYWRDADQRVMALVDREAGARLPSTSPERATTVPG